MSAGPDDVWIWCGGRLVRAAEATVPALDQGFLTGRGVFETLAARAGRVCLLERHLARLQHGAARLRLAVPGREVIAGALTEVLAANGLREARLRITLSGGPVPGLALRPGQETLVISAGPLPELTSPARLLTVPWRRNPDDPLTGIKSTGWSGNMVAQTWAEERGGTEALFCDLAGNLCEGAKSNLFVIRGGEVLTPPLTSGCLPGVARALVLEICEDLGIPARERSLPAAGLNAADSVFLTSATRLVHPAASLDGLVLTDSPLTHRLRDAALARVMEAPGAGRRHEN